MFSSAVLRVARVATPASNKLFSPAARVRAATSSAVSTNVGGDDGPATVFEKIVKVTIIDPSGARRVIPAYVGQSLYEACNLNNIDLGPVSVGSPVQKVRSSTWTEPLFGEGPTSGFDHVLLQGGNKGVELVEPPCQAEMKMLSHYWDEDEIYPESRLASQVEINGEMDGMVVYVPDRLVDDIP